MLSTYEAGNSITIAAAYQQLNDRTQKGFSLSFEEASMAN